MITEELEDILVLYQTEGLSRRDAGRLVQQAGHPRVVFGMGAADLAGWGIKKTVIRAILERRMTDGIRSETDFVQRNGIRAIGFWEADYPPLLRECPDAPVMLFGKGTFDFSDTPLALSIVGTRSVTPYGAAATERIVQALAPYRPLIVSGLAYGVDVQAHRAALKYGLPTVGVLGQGLGTPMYPAQNRDTARQMCAAAGCGILTEYSHLQEAIPGLFPARNRIVAGISRATIVVEAKDKGGALITANLACGYDREVFAVPGRITDPCSAGCNSLIRQNKALIVDDPQAIAQELGLSERKKANRPLRMENSGKDLFSPEAADGGKNPSLEGLDPDGKNIVRALVPVEKMHLDELCTALEMPVQRLSPLLLEMELRGIIETLPGKYYALEPGARK